MTEAEVVEGARVRVLDDVELRDGRMLGPGERGRVHSVFRGDEPKAFVELDRFPGSRVKFEGVDDFKCLAAL